jgi:hypothetical protein
MHKALITADDFRLLLRVLAAFVRGERPTDLVQPAHDLLRKLAAQRSS